MAQTKKARKKPPADGSSKKPPAETARPKPPVDADRQSNMWGMLCHLTAFTGLIGVPFGTIIGPLVIWLLKKDEFPFVDEQGKESLNFQLSMLIYGFVAAALCLLVIGFPLLIALYLADLVFLVVASVKANEGESYRYPLTIRFIQ